MKRLSLTVVVVAGVFGALGLLAVARGQGNAGTRAARPAPPTRVAVVDLIHIYKNYQKCEDLQEELKEALQQAQDKASSMDQQLRLINDQIASGALEGDSPERVEQENKLIQLQSKAKLHQVRTKLNVQRKQSQALCDVFSDVRLALDKFAEQNGFTLILQVNRDAMAASDPSVIQQTMSHHVISNRGGEDITEAVLAYLTRQYNSSSRAQKPDSAVEHASAKTAPPAATSSGRKASPKTTSPAGRRNNR
ncbi:MAG: OmpH family outer membrane protein [Planctomycetales bacterium]